MGYMDDLAEHALEWDQYTRGEASIIAGVIRELFDEAVVELRGVDFDELYTLSAGARNQRLASLVQQVTGRLQSDIHGLEAGLTTRLVDLGSWHQSWQVAATNAALGVAIMQPVMNDLAIAEMVSNMLVEGRHASEWWAKLAEDTRSAAAQQIRLGVLRGETMPDIVRRIRGKSTGKRKSYRLKDGSLRYKTQFKGGVMGTATRDAETLVLTSSAHVSGDINRKLLEGNDDAFEGLKQASTLDSQTSPTCRKYDGKEFLFPDMKPRGHNLPYDGGVPRHPRCRSIEIALLRQTEDMRRRGMDPNRIPGRQRASEFGQTKSDWNFYDWLSRSYYKHFHY